MAALRQRSFRHSAHGTAAASEQYFHRIFFDGPFNDPELPSLVHEDDDGRILGFVGRIARKMILAGEPVRMAVTTQLCVDADGPKTVAVQLLNHVLRGPQDLIWTDSATDRVRLLWRRLGGEVARVQSLRWTLDTRPSRAALSGVAGSATTRAMRLAARLTLGDADRTLVRRATAASSHLRSETVSDLENVGGEIRKLAGSTLSSAEDPAAVGWLLQQVQQKYPETPLRRTVLRNTGGSVVGFYAYFPRRGSIADVVQLQAVEAEYRAVLAHLALDAARQGAHQLGGRLEPALVDGLGDTTIRASRGAPWALFHTRRPEIRHAIHSGHTDLSRLDGEWWLNF